MKPGILRVSGTVDAEIKATKAFIYLVVGVNMEKLLFGGTAIVDSKELKSTIDGVKLIDKNIEVETESITFEYEKGFLGNNSIANYSLKITVKSLKNLGRILDVCFKNKRAKIQSIEWDYNIEKEKLKLVKIATKKAHEKANIMMKGIGYSLLGIRRCSDSHIIPNHELRKLDFNNFDEFDNFGETTGAETIGSNKIEDDMNNKINSIAFDIEFKKKIKIYSTCIIEFWINKVDEDRM